MVGHIPLEDAIGVRVPDRQHEEKTSVSVPVFFLYICPAVDSNGGAIRGVCDEAASRVQRSYERSELEKAGLEKVACYFEKIAATCTEAVSFESGSPSNELRLIFKGCI